MIISQGKVQLYDIFHRHLHGIQHKKVKNQIVQFEIDLVVNRYQQRFWKNGF
mgnify:CR=1 FL=1